MSFVRRLGLAASVLGLTAAAAASCSSDPGTSAAGPGGGGGTPGPGGDAGSNVVIGDLPDAQSDPVSAEPGATNPKDDTGGDLGWSNAPPMDGVAAAVERDSAVVSLPSVAGAKDYRAILVPAGVQVTADASGKETIKGTTIYCAGFRQRSAPAGPLELLRQIEVAGLLGETRVVLEAIDTPCPFTGLMGSAHGDVSVTSTEVPASDRVDFSVFTEQEIVSKYGSLIVNGHGAPAKIGTQADPAPPKVLARTTVKVKPLGNALAPPVTTLFDGFAEADSPKVIAQNGSAAETILQNKNWTFYSYAADLAQIFVDRGQLHYLLADTGQDVFASNVAFPKKPVQLSTTDYLHVTFEVASAATPRRYWWISLCGAETAGSTIAANGTLVTRIKQTPFFMDDDGQNPSEAGWNCLQVFPRSGWPFPLPPNNTNPESEVRVMLNKAGNFPRDSVINVSPAMYDPGIGPPSWYRQRDKSGKLVAPMIDDQQLIAPRTRFDFYIRRDRFVMYVNGAQKICNDFPATPLTMAEGALGFGQVLYHSTAERLEFAGPFVRTGMVYYLEDTPYIDHRAWDNMGYGEHSGAPGNFDESVCFKP